MPARMHHVSIFVQDMERALQLFNGILGLEILQRLEGVRGEGLSTLLGMPDFQADMVFLKHPDQRICLELVRRTGPGQDSADSRGAAGFGLSLTVPDLNAVHAELKQAGWPPLSQPMRMTDPSGRAIRLFCFRTAEGLMVELIQNAG